MLVTDPKSVSRSMFWRRSGSLPRVSAGVVYFVCTCVLAFLRCLRLRRCGLHWRLSQLETKAASEPEWVQTGIALRQVDSISIPFPNSLSSLLSRAVRSLPLVFRRSRHFSPTGNSNAAHRSGQRLPILLE